MTKDMAVFVIKAIKDKLYPYESFGPKERKECMNLLDVALRELGEDMNR